MELPTRTPKPPACSPTNRLSAPRASATIACKCHEKLRAFGNPSRWAANRPAGTSRSAGTEPGTALCNFVTRSKTKRERNSENWMGTFPFVIILVKQRQQGQRMYFGQGPVGDFINRNMQKITRSLYSWIPTLLIILCFFSHLSRFVTRDSCTPSRGIHSSRTRMDSKYWNASHIFTGI